jgi:hypothetical protein
MRRIRHSEYMALLDQIAELQRRKLSVEKQKQKLRDRIHIIRAKLTIEIGTAKDNKGKPVYSNESLRDAALTLKLEEHSEYSTLRDQLRRHDGEVSDIVIEYNKLVDQKYLLMTELGISSESEGEKYPDVH